MTSPFSPQNYLDKTQTQHWELFSSAENAWDVLNQIGAYLEKNLTPGRAHEYPGVYIGEKVYISAGTTIEPGAVIKGPAWIGADCRIGPSAFIRDNVIVGDQCVLGNSCEFKNCVLFNKVAVPHFSYVGDSVLGHAVHLAAGVICSNLKLGGRPVSFVHEGRTYHTGLRKFGSIIGDRAEIGCNTVLNPGSIIGRDSIIYPGVQWRGVLAEKSVAKHTSVVQVVPRHD
jgi:NDP-sugar pyrophosphorylase family protein